MANLLNVALMDLGNLTPFQKELHEPDPKNPDEPIDARFTAEIRKIAWTTDLYTELTAVPEGKFIVYKIDTNFHVLRYTVLRLKLLALRVKEALKDRIRICWTPNLMINIIISGALCVNDEPAQTIDYVTLNMWLHMLFNNTRPGAREAVVAGIGNVDFLTNWTTFLPEYPLQFKLPWSYADHDLRALPIFRATKTPLKHRFHFRLDLKDLVRMQKYMLDLNNPEDYYGRYESHWKDIKFDPRCLDGVPSNGKLPDPTLWGKYGHMTEVERVTQLYGPKPKNMTEAEWESHWKSHPDRTTSYSLYIDDVVPWSTNDYKSYGTPITVPLNSKDPCKFIGWVAENMAATENRLYSNFTTCAEDPSKGWNPYSNFKLTYGVTERIPELETDHSDRISHICDLPSCAFAPGYNGISFAGDLRSFDADIAQSFKKLGAELTLTLQNTDPFLKPVQTNRDLTPDEIAAEEEQTTTEKDKPLFRIHVRCIVVKKLLFEGNTCKIVAESKRESDRSFGK